MALALLIQTGDLETQVERLTSLKKSECHEAYTVLRASVPEAIPVLRRYAKRVTTAKHRKTVAETLTYFLRVEAREYFKKGEIDRSLAYYAEAAGASDIDAYVKKRLENTRAEIRARFPRHVIIHSYSSMAHSLKGAYGPWGVKALIEELSLNRFRSTMSGMDVIRLLSEMGYEAVPSLRDALSSKDSRQKCGALSVFSEMWWRGKKVDVTEGMLEALEKLRDESPDRYTRQKATRLLRWIEAARERKR